MKLFLWRGFDLSDFGRSGLAFAIAETEEQARAIVAKSINDGEDYDWCKLVEDWGPLEVHDLLEPVGAAVTGHD